MRYSNVTIKGVSYFEDCEDCDAIAIYLRDGWNCLERIFSKFSNYDFTTIEILENVELKGKICKVVSIGSFGEDQKVEKVILPKSIERIKRSAFRNCSNLKEINLPSSLEEIECRAFEGCKNLQRIEIPESVKFIDESVFEGCENLCEVKLPSGLESIGDSAFKNCVNLKKINLPESLYYIGKNAFSNCKSLEQIIIPNDVISIQGKTFESCESLRKVSIPGSVGNIGCEAFCSCTSLEELEIGEGVKCIDSSAFECCESLKFVKIPNTVTYMSECVFNGCTSLKNVVLSNSLSIIKDETFSDCESLESIEIPEGVITIEEFAFDGCTNLKEVKLPNTLVRDEGSFGNCPSLNKIDFPYALRYLCDDYVKTVNLPSELNYIEDGDEQKVSIDRFPDTINDAISVEMESSFSSRIFASDSTMKFFVLNEKSCALLSYGGDATELEIPSHVFNFLEQYEVTSIFKGAFYNASNLKTVVIPASVKVMYYDDTIEFISQNPYLIYTDFMYLYSDEVFYSNYADYPKSVHKKLSLVRQYNDYLFTQKDFYMRRVTDMGMDGCFVSTLQDGKLITKDWVTYEEIRNILPCLIEQQIFEISEKNIFITLHNYIASRLYDEEDYPYFRWENGQSIAVNLRVMIVDNGNVVYEYQKEDTSENVYDEEEEYHYFDEDFMDEIKWYEFSSRYRIFSDATVEQIKYMEDSYPEVFKNRGTFYNKKEIVDSDFIYFKFYEDAVNAAKLLSLKCQLKCMVAVCCSSCDEELDG